MSHRSRLRTIVQISQKKNQAHGPRIQFPNPPPNFPESGIVAPARRATNGRSPSHWPPGLGPSYSLSTEGGWVRAAFPPTDEAAEDGSNPTRPHPAFVFFFESFEKSVG